MGKSSELRWDSYFINICDAVAKNSKCLSRKIGAILVKDRAIISTGYNGPVRGAKHCNERDISFYDQINETIIPFIEKTKNECPRRSFGYKSGEGLHLCQAGHAERNTLIQAARNGISTLGATLYCNCGQVCKDCAIEIVNAGIKELVYLDGHPDYDKYSSVILEEGGIKIRKVYQDAI